MFTLSVIVPNYNNEKYLVECIESIINQSFLPNEIIIVDDCSTDNSKDIITKLKEKYEIIKPIFLEINLGVSHARNIGAKYASSKYITFLDGDDLYYCFDKLKNEMALISKFEKPDNLFVISYSKIVFIDENNSLIKKLDFKNSVYPKGKIFFKLLTGINEKAIPRDYCFNVELFKKVKGYDENMNLFEDLDLLIRLSQLGDFYFTDTYGTAYRQKKGGLSKRTNNEIKIAKNTIYKRYTKNKSNIYKIVSRLTRLYVRIFSFIGNEFKKYKNSK